MEQDYNRLFTCFTVDGRETLLRSSSEKTYSADEVIFNEGDPVDGIYVVLEGNVLIGKQSAGHIVPISTVETGDYFGELGILEGGTRSAMAASIGNTRILWVPAAIIHQVLAKEPFETSIHLFERIFQYLRSTNNKFAHEVLRKEKLHIIGEMAGSIIHDLKNPITAIQLSAELISDMHHDDRTRKRCETIVSQSRRMVNMVQEILDFARGKVTVPVCPIALQSVFDQFVLSFPNLMNQQNAPVHLNATHVRIVGNSDRLLRVFQNLIGNAIEAIGSAGGEIHVTVEDSDPVLIRVIDNGPGIPEAIRETVFEPFITHGKERGTGLGMSIAKMIIEAHNGRIWFETETGKGTTFFIELKRA